MTLEADAAITADRYELTYLVPDHQRRELADCFEQRLPAHHHASAGEAPRPALQHFVTTVYFDTPTERLLTAATANVDHNVKLRAKEYYDLSPDAATRLENPVPADQLWLELKRRTGARTLKHRIRLSKSALLRWLQERAAPAPSDYLGREADARVLADYLASEPEPLSPVCVASYCRCSWQSADGQLRLTLDDKLGFFSPPAELLCRREQLREQLGQPCAREARTLLEVKRRAAAQPDWLGARLHSLGLEAADYSKFVNAAKAVARSRVDA